MTNSLTFHALLAAKRRDVRVALEAAAPLLTEAPDARPASDASYADPTADVALHPARLAVSSAYRSVQQLEAAIALVSRADHLLNVLYEAVEEWHGGDADPLD